MTVWSGEEAGITDDFWKWQKCALTSSHRQHQSDWWQKERDRCVDEVTQRGAERFSQGNTWAQQNATDAPHTQYTHKHSAGILPQSSKIHKHTGLLLSYPQILTRKNNNCFKTHASLAVKHTLVYVYMCYAVDISSINTHTVCMRNM